MKPVELLAPAGSPECLNAAVGEGADAVYLGLKDFNARLRSANFAYSQFEGALRTLHRMGRRVYVAVNTVFEQREADRMYQFLQYLSRTGPDGIIVQDLGTAKMAAECFPALDIHASTQMNVSSARAANLLSKHKVRRVVLARELSAAEITSVRQNTNVELETFVHGALCVSASGLCLFSSYLGGKSANRGMCTQACRRLYQSDGESSGYYFSLPDLQLLGEVKTLAAAGINALKIEGRMKSAEYVGAVTAAYRRVIDALDAPDEAYQAALSDGLRLLKGDFARSKTKYLFYPEASGEKETVVGHNEPPCTPPDWLCPQQSGGAGIFLGAITKTRGAGEDFMAAVPRPGMAAGGETAEMALEAGDSIRVHSGDDSRRVSHKVKRVYEQGGVLWLSAPEGAAAGDAVYVIQKKSKNKRHPQIVPENLTPYKKRPGFDRAPDVPALFPRRGAETKAGTEKKRTSRTAADTVLPEGIYAAVSCIEDLYIVQSARPAAVIVPLTGKTLPALLNVHGASGTAPLPFKSEDIILSFDPIVTDAAEAEFAAALPRLYELGFRVYIANNISQFSLVESLAASVTRNAGSTAVQTAASAHPAANKAAAHAASVNTAAHGKKNLKKSPAAGPVMIAGPYIYTFNRFAASFAAGAGASYFVMPYEDSRQNLEKTFIAEERQRLFITVYARPALFRIRPNLGAVYSFKQFTDNTADNFNLRPLSADGGGTNTVVTPQTPFSIVDKIPFLKEAGFRRFILDFSGAALKKTAYKDIIKHTETASPIKGASRFNWKNGFYRIKSDE